MSRSEKSSVEVEKEAGEREEKVCFSLCARLFLGNVKHRR